MRRWGWLVLLLAATAQAGEWPQFLGPGRNGVSGETGLVTGWKAGTKVRWRVPVGPGYASVAVAGGVVYAMGSNGGQEELLALDAVTGKPRWKAPIGPFWKDGSGYDGPRATPAVSGDRVIALTGAGRLAAVSRVDGKVIWTVDLPALGGERPQYGYAASPLVVDGKVMVSAGGGTGLVALSTRDGSVAWKRSGFPAAGYASAVRTALSGRDQVLFFTGEQVAGVQPADGAVIWQQAWGNEYDINAASPVVLASNRVYVGTGYGVGGLALEVGSTGTVREVWRSKKTKNKTSTAVLHQGHLYGFNDDRLNCTDALTGEEKWSQQGFGRGALLLADGHLFVQTEDCRHVVVKATPAGFQQVGEPVRVLTETTECFGTPALSDGVLYVRDNKELAAIEVKPPAR